MSEHILEEPVRRSDPARARDRFSAASSPEPRVEPACAPPRPTHSLAAIAVAPPAGYLIDEEKPEEERAAGLGQGRTVGQPTTAHDTGPPPVDTVRPEDLTPAATCAITSSTFFRAPDGTPNTRTEVGIGEAVVFEAGGMAEWTASSGWPRSRTAPTFAWEPAVPGTTRIAARNTLGGATCSIEMTAIAPTGITMVKHAEDTFPAGTMGAGMLLEAHIAPRHVSFGNLEWLEIPGHATGVSGYFDAQQKKGADLSHHPNPKFVRLRANNTFRSDHAAFSGYPRSSGTPPFWFPGGAFQWTIPNHYRRAGNPSPLGTFFTNTVQQFFLGADGRATVSKGGDTVTRRP